MEGRLFTELANLQERAAQLQPELQADVEEMSRQLLEAQPDLEQLVEPPVTVKEVATLSLWQVSAVPGMISGLERIAEAAPRVEWRQQALVSTRARSGTRWARASQRRWSRASRS